MKKMINRRRIIPLVVLAIAAASCLDNSYRGYEEIAEKKFALPLDVHVALGTPFTRGSGAIDSLENFADKEFLVWAFNSDTLNPSTKDTIDYSLPREQDTLNCLIDGYPATIEKGASAIAKWKGGRRFFYPRAELSSVKYDFFAAFLDGIDIQSRDAFSDHIELRAEIDGSNDILTAKAPLPTLNGVPKEYAFSYRSAYEGLIPEFTMNHNTVRIDFVVKPGIASGNTSPVIVDSVILQARPDVVIIPAAKDTSKIGVEFRSDRKKFLHLTDVGGRKLMPDTLRIVDGAQDPVMAKREQKAKTHQLGGGFFVSPENYYLLRMRLHEPEHSEAFQDRGIIEDTVRLVDRTAMFKQGGRYVVNMTIYGERDVYFTVRLVPWAEGGSFVIDPDAESELIELQVVAADIEMAVGETVKIEPRIMINMVPTVLKEVVYSYRSLDRAIASVDSSTGEVTGLSPGETWIMITASRSAVGDLYGGNGIRVIKVKVN